MRERGRHKIIQGDVLEKLEGIPSGVVQLCVTSPPYFALRSYLPADHPGKAREMGSEKTVEEYLAGMVRVFRGVRRVLSDSGLLFLNMGDSYNGSGTTSTVPANYAGGGCRSWGYVNKRPTNVEGYKAGELLNVPHRLAEALRADGWLWRQTIVWAKRCLSGGTWLYARTAKGDSPAILKDLVRLDPETVQLWNGQKWTQVLGWTRTLPVRGSRRRGERTGYLEIVLRSGERIGCTAEHRWPTERGVVFASDLQVGDVIQTCRLPEPEIVQPLCLPDVDFGWLLGFYLAEGFQTEKGINFSIHADEIDAYKKVQRLAKLVGGTATYQRHKGKAAVIVVYSKTLKAFVGEYITGKTCYNKRLGRKAWMRGNTFLAAILDGYLEGDGHWDKRKRSWMLGFTNNDGMVVDLRCLCARLNKVCVLRRVANKCNGKVFPGWRGRIREPSTHWNTEPAGKVVAVENSRARKFWDIAVADEPNLFALASGVLSHNSPMPESCKGWRWERCRVKVGGGWEPQRNANRDDGHSGHISNRETTVWSPCPGCPRCEPNGGWVLRRGRGRCTTAHEFIFVMAKTGAYFWDSAAFVEQLLSNPRGWGRHSKKDPGLVAVNPRPMFGADRGDRDGTEWGDGQTRNPRSVWKIPEEFDESTTLWELSTEPSSEPHFATFPSELVRRCVQAGTSDGGQCKKCKVPFAPVVESRLLKRERPSDRTGYHEGCDGNTVAGVDTRITGYRPACDCGAGDPKPQTVLDPFAGTGTTLQTAVWMGRNAIGVELNEKYVGIMREEVGEPPAWWLKRRGKSKAKKRKGGFGL